MTQQDTVLEYLLKRLYNGQPSVDLIEISKEFNLTSNQVAKIKTELVKKGKAKDFGRGKMGAVRLIPRPKNAICTRLRKKDGRFYCPVKNHFIAGKDKDYLCGMIQYTTGGNGIGYYNVCEFKGD